MSSTIKLDKDENGKALDITKYRGMVGSLLYFIASRSDIMFSICLCARFESNTKESLFSVVTRILMYFHDTINLGLCYPKDIHFNISSYSDANFSC